MVVDSTPASAASASGPRLVPLSLARLGGNGLFRFVYPFLGVVAVDVGLGEGSETVLITALAVGGMILPAVSRRMSGDEDRPRLSSATGLLAMFVGTLLLGGLAPTLAGTAHWLGIGTALLAMVVLGLAKPLLDIGSMTYVSARVGWAGRGRALSVMELTWAGGLLVLAPVGLVAERIGWRPTIVLLGVVVALTTPLLHRWLDPDAVTVQLATSAAASTATTTAAADPHAPVPHHDAGTGAPTSHGRDDTDAPTPHGHDTTITPTRDTPAGAGRPDGHASTDAPAPHGRAGTGVTPPTSPGTDATAPVEAGTGPPDDHARTASPNTRTGHETATRARPGPAPVGRSGALFLVVFALVFVALETTFGVVGLWLEDVRGIAPGRVATLTAVGGLGELGGSLFTVAVADRVGKARTAAIGLLCCAVGFGLLGVAGPLWLALLGLAVGLFGTETAIVAGIPLASEIDPSRRAAFLSRAVAASSVSRAVVGLASARLLLAGGIALNTGISVAAALLAVAGVVVLLRIEPRLRG